MHLSTNTTYTLTDLGDTWQLSTDTKTEELDPVTDLHLPENCQLTYQFRWKNQSVNRTITLHLDGDGAAGKFLGGFIIGGDHQITLRSTITHHGINTSGDCLIKGVLTDQAQASLSGMIKIESQASGSQDQLTERLLILSDGAIGQLQPELEIANDDVKASHATTISHVDPLQVWYLRSRGVTKHQSQELLVEGFLKEVLVD